MEQVQATRTGRVAPNGTIDRWVPSTCGLCSIGCGLPAAKGTSGPAADAPIHDMRIDVLRERCEGSVPTIAIRAPRVRKYW
jgi:hypothetical protein